MWRSIFSRPVDSLQRTLFCFVTDDGKESPTLHVKPGDTINITLTNMLPAMPGAPSMRVSNDTTVCGSPDMTVTSVNMHFHGTNTSPTCHSDEVIHTLINSGETFTYRATNSRRTSHRGLYWYHPHVHGISSVQNSQGGATGAIEVEELKSIQPAVADLPRRYLVLRDQRLGAPNFDTVLTGPVWDGSVNDVPVSWPYYQPSIIKMQAGGRDSGGSSMPRQHDPGHTADL